MIRRAAVRSALMASIALCAGIAIGQTLAPRKPAPPAQALVVSAARQLGVRRCLPALSAVAQRAVQGAVLQDIMVDWDRQVPDAYPFFSLTGLGADKQRAILTIAAAPGTGASGGAGGGCAIQVERISATPQSCASVAANELPGYPGAALIDGILVHQNPKQPGETYALMSNGTGCVIVRRQTAMRWGAPS